MYTNKGLTAADRVERLHHASVFCRAMLVPPYMCAAISSSLLGVIMLATHRDVVGLLLLGMGGGICGIVIYMALTFVHQLRATE